MAKTSERTLKTIARLIDESLTVRIDPSARIILAIWTGDFAAADALEIVSGRKAYKRRHDRREFRLTAEEDVGRLLMAVRPYVVQKADLIDATMAYLSTTDPDQAMLALLRLGDLAS